VGARDAGLPTLGGALKVLLPSRAFAVLLALFASGCVQQAVLENDVRSAQWKARTLTTAADIALAHAALSAQLVELEALYQRDPGDARVLGLLDRGYRLMAEGFVELRRLEALSAGDAARAEQELTLRTDAESRARYYRTKLGAIAEERETINLTRDFAEAEAACARHERAAYEARLNVILATPESTPEQRLERAISRKLAAAWLMPNVALRCKF
jgi:hypothetical protein